MQVHMWSEMDEMIQKHCNFGGNLDTRTFSEHLLDFRTKLWDLAGLHFINLRCAVYFRRYIVMKCCNLLPAALTFCFVYFLNTMLFISQNTHSSFWQPPGNRFELVALSFKLYKHYE